MRRKSSIISYEKFMREASTTHGSFSCSQLAAKHGISKGVGVTLREKGLVNPAKRKQTVWVGPKNMDNETLYKLTREVMSYTLKRQRGMRKPNPKPIVVVTEVSKPVVRSHHKKPEAPKIGLIRRFIRWLY